MTTAATTLLIAKVRNAFVHVSREIAYYPTLSSVPRCMQYFGGQGASQVSRLAPIWRSGGEWLLKNGPSKGNRLSTSSATARNTSK
mmetsp:Transcript_10808/g.21475  ORF Transcript_10808/g.21475 Transcript_10808/m.21475 type:complete len:86 (-) Transcript_10808:3900-4157(-)